MRVFITGATGYIGFAVASAFAAKGHQVCSIIYTSTLNQHVDASKAAQLLGWQPRHGGFVDGVDRYFKAWKSLQS